MCHDLSSDEWPMHHQSQLLTLCLLIISFSLTAVVADEPPQGLPTSVPAWDNRFQRQEGWIGADGNYSVRVAPDRVLWFFSDSLIGKIQNGRRESTRMINNSVGVQQGDHVEFYYRTDSSGNPQSLFRPDEPAHWEWPVGATAIDGRVHLLTWELRKTSEAGAFGFEMVGVNQIRIDNPLDLPTAWNLTRTRVPHAEFSRERHTSWGAAVMADGEFVYVYGTQSFPEQRLKPRKMILARSPRQSFEDYSTWEFRTSAGWSREPRNLDHLSSAIATEYSVHRMLDREEYLCVSHADFLSPRIQARVAPRPEGPWSDTIDLWTCPEPASHRKYFAYSGKAHSEISGKNELMITYAVNSLEFGDLFSDPTLYWPRFVRVPLPLPVIPSRSQ